MQLIWGKKIYVFHTVCIVNLKISIIKAYN